MVEAVDEKTAAIKKQIEYYLSDTNLTFDKFFRDQIITDKEGWVSIAHFLNCNKVKQMSITQEQIAEACKDSEEVEVHEGKTKIRRKGNKPLPEKAERKRDVKAAEK